jgi:hypothetical protein
MECLLGCVPRLQVAKLFVCVCAVDTESWVGSSSQISQCWLCNSPAFLAGSSAAGKQIQTVPMVLPGLLTPISQPM